MNTTYTTLLIDADETLLDFRRAQETALKAVCADFLLPFSDALNARYYAINQSLWQQLERGEITRDRLRVQRFEELFSSLGIDGADPAAVNEAYTARLGRCGCLLPHAKETVAALSARYRLYIITNGSACVQHTRLEDSGLMPFVQEVFISEEIGADKPSQVYFRRVLSRVAEQDRRRILVIGDSLSSDIGGGLEAGLDTCWLNAHGALLPQGTCPTFQVASLPALCALLL